ncbi:phage tail assembly chaperone [Serratia sp. PL7]|uniref:phage tail assembly chaperone n=1 Tax=Serratia sp. PL7 TaxID=2952201 RepID=UPI002003C8A0|nr:phage tail assembly chaperone [Serratia sp. PL7]
MTDKKMNLRDVASTPLAGFRTKIETVPEWNGVKVLLREPSPEGLGIFREVLAEPEVKEGEKPVKLSIADETKRNTKADAVLFIDILFDIDGNQAFSQDDVEKVMVFYGPVHRRLLEKALALQTKKEDAEAK